MLVGVRRNRARGENANEGKHFDHDCFVIVNDGRQGALDDYFATEFLANLTDDGGGGIFAGFNFAAGEFPFEGQKLIRGSLREQQKIVSLDECADNGNEGGSGHELVLNKGKVDGATFLQARCFLTMKTFLKVMLVIVLLFVAIKLSPIVFVAALIGLLAAALLGAVGLSLLAGLVAVVVALTAALSPIWIPVLLVMGAISLFKKHNDRSTPPAMAA